MKEQFGEKGYGVQKIYYKGNRYFTEYSLGNEEGYQLYHPEDGLLYAWQAGSDSATTVNSKKYMDAAQGVSDADDTATILGIECKTMVVKGTFGESKYWYNSDYFKMDASLYEGHVYGNWEAVLNKIGSLPIKIEMKGMAPAVLTMMDYKEEAVPDSKFELPNFKTITANPMN